jgi:hypothetical protein
MSPHAKIGDGGTFHRRLQGYFSILFDNLADRTLVDDFWTIRENL